MKKYRKTIERRRILCGLIALVAVCVAIMDTSGIMKKIIGDRYIGEVVEFQTGILIGLGMVALVWFINYTKSLRDEEKLRVLYNGEHDERKKMIKSKAGMPMLLICSSVMIFAGIIAGYFSRTVFIVLILAASFQMMAGAAVKIYYLKNM